MGLRPAIALYVLGMIALVVGVDVLFFRHNLGLRLIANVGIVLIFGLCYFSFLRNR